MTDGHDEPRPRVSGIRLFRPACALDEGKPRANAWPASRGPLNEGRGGRYHGLRAGGIIPRGLGA